jgi:molecular chaperone GrpE (heat shock protein)
VVPADGVLAHQLEQVQAERGTLVQTCIYVRDRATSKAIADRLGWALQEVGVSTVAPTGATFDPAHHEAGGATATAERAKVGTIAAVEVPGYVDRGVVVRAPVVTVYREERV